MYMNINLSLLKIKQLLENSIIQNGTVGKRNLIRTSQPINVIHEVVKQGFVGLNISQERIFPRLTETRGEVSITGFIKKKNQDIVILPENITPSQEYIEHLDFRDPYGQYYSERILSVNVRSQLSSVAKNFDTIFERTFAESYNLHQRLNKIVLGEVFLLPIREFDDSYSDNNIVKYKDLGNRVEKQLSKYPKYGMTARQQLPKAEAEMALAEYKRVRVEMTGKRAAALERRVAAAKKRVKNKLGMMMALKSKGFGDFSFMQKIKAAEEKSCTPDNSRPNSPE